MQPWRCRKAAAESNEEVSRRNECGPGQPIVLQHRGLIQTVILILTAVAQRQPLWWLATTREMLISKM